MVRGMLDRLLDLFWGDTWDGIDLLPPEPEPFSVVFFERLDGWALVSAELDGHLFFGWHYQPAGPLTRKDLN